MWSCTDAREAGTCVIYVIRGAADPIPFHAFRGRACRYYSLSLPFAAWWSPHKSDDMGARARTVRVRPSWSVWSGLVAPPPTQRPVILILIAHCYMAVTRGPPLHPPSYSTQARTRGVRVVQTQRRHEYVRYGACRPPMHTPRGTASTRQYTSYTTETLCTALVCPLHQHRREGGSGSRKFTRKRKLGSVSKLGRRGAPSLAPRREIVPLCGGPASGACRRA